MNGHVLVRDGRIAAIWKGGKPPVGIDLTGVVRVPLGPQAYIYPGLINLHDHPFYSVLPLWQTPSSHRQPDLGRPLGTEPYSNRYQWNSAPAQPEEAARLIANPSALLTQSSGLGQLGDVITFGKARMILGGTTTTQGGLSSPGHDSLLARNVENTNFDRRRIFSRVPAVAALSSSDAALVRTGMSAGLVDAWLVHLAEGVRDADRRAGDPTSSRAEFAALKCMNLLTDATVIVHGVGLEPADFAEMAHAPAARADGAGDGRGAKLVWSPLSNLLLYGQTTAVYDALAAGVLVSLGTDWTPSGSANLLTELKVADRTLRDPRLLGGASRHRAGTRRRADDDDGGAAERALDQLLVEMVTINPARAVRWDDQVGSIEVGKTADLLVIEAQPTPQDDSGDLTVALSAADRCDRAGCGPGDGGGSRASGRRGCHVGAQARRLRSRQQSSRLFRQGDRRHGGVGSTRDRDAGPDLSANRRRLARARWRSPASRRRAASPFTNTWSYLQANIPGASALPESHVQFASCLLLRDNRGRQAEP